MDKSLRLSYIDWAKVTCILLMICCHAGQKGLILDITYQFHMPLFFIISGMLFRPKGVILELKLFGFPIFLFGVVKILYSFSKFLLDGASLTAYNIIISESFKSLLFNSSISWFQGYWFVITLLLMRILMNNSLINRFKVTIALMCIIWSTIEPFFILPDYITSFKPYHIISCFPFFITGMLLKDMNINITKGTFECKCIVAFVFVILTFFQGRVDLAYYQYGQSYLILFINALLGSYIMLNLMSLFPTRKYIQSLSTGTFLILGLHGLMYGYINQIIKFLSINNPYTPLLTGLIVLVLLLPIIVILEKYYPIVLGKSRKI